MENSYYSKKHGRYFSKRLDLLIYAHDGRGLGHASRGIAIGMAMRRLFPKCKILFISGCKQANALIGPAPLDWMKLPAHETTVIEGRTEGADGDSNFYKSVLGQLRGDMLESIMEIFKPRLVLVDHAPSGRRDELHPALKKMENTDTRWVLGIRGVVGEDKDVWSDRSARLFRRFYHSILWYGDANVLGTSCPEGIERHFGVKPIETGYVSRLSEINRLMKPEKDPLAGTISIPWGSDTTWVFVENLHAAIESIGDQYGLWRLFVAEGKKEAIQDRFRNLPFCTINAVSEAYVPSLLNSRLAVIYAGYNSIMDILAVKIPSVVILRDIRDNEQQEHLEKLLPYANESIQVLSEATANAKTLESTLEKLFHASAWNFEAVNMRGAELAADFLAGELECKGSHKNKLA